MLAITGLALDNSLVYGDAFGMTDMLYKFWRIMVAIAFGMMILIILREILSNLWEQKDIQSIIWWKLIKWIMMGVLIPASWFIIAVLIDFSSILIYQVWSIPLTVLGKDDHLNKKLLESHSTFNMSQPLWWEQTDKWWFRFTTIYTCNQKAYVVCPFETYYKDWQNGQHITKESRDAYIVSQKQKFTGYTINEWYCVLSPTELLSLSSFPVYFNVWTWGKGNFIAQYNWGMSFLNKEAWCGSIKNLIDQSKGMVGTLYTIYWSLLNFASINTTDSHKSTEAEVMLFFIKWIVWILLIFPLIALWLISIARIGLLWIIIAFSPLLIIIRVEGKSWIGGATSKWLDGAWWKNMWAKLKTGVGDVLSLIFQPVMTVLTLSISIVLLSATSEMIGSGGENTLLWALGISVDRESKWGDSYQCLRQKELWYGDVCISDFNASYATTVFFDYFTRIIVNMLWILIMWNLLFSSLKFSKMTQSIAEKVEKFGGDKLSTLPVFGGKSKTYRDTYFDEMGGTAKKKFIDDPIKKDKEAGEEQNKALWNRISSSPEAIKHNKEFSHDYLNDDTIAKKPTEAFEAWADTLVKWIGIEDSKYKPWLSASSESISKWWVDYRNKIKQSSKAIGWFNGDNLAQSIGEANFWHTVALGKWWSSLIEKIWSKEIINNKAWITNRVGRGMEETFLNNRTTWIQQVIDSATAKRTINTSKEWLIHKLWNNNKQYRVEYIMEKSENGDISLKSWSMIKKIEDKTSLDMANNIITDYGISANEMDSLIDKSKIKIGDDGKFQLISDATAPAH